MDTAESSEAGPSVVSSRAESIATDGGSGPTPAVVRLRGSSPDPVAAGGTSGAVQDHPPGGDDWSFLPPTWRASSASRRGSSAARGGAGAGAGARRVRRRWKTSGDLDEEAEDEPAAAMDAHARTADSSSRESSPVAADDPFRVASNSRAQGRSRGGPAGSRIAAVVAKLEGGSDAASATGAGISSAGYRGGTDEERREQFLRRPKPDQQHQSRNVANGSGGRGEQKKCYGHTSIRDLQSSTSSAAPAGDGAGGQPTADGCASCKQLRQRVAAAETDAAGKAWAVERAVELSDAVARLEATGHEIATELDDANDSLLALKQRNRELEANLDLAARVNKVLIASNDACLRCHSADEADGRGEVAAQERARRHALEASWAAVARPWRFSKRQTVESEVELMWREDQRAHAAALKVMQEEVNHLGRVRMQLHAAHQEGEKWKAKYRDLKEKGRVHIDELRAVHEENMRRARSTYLRCNPNHATLLWGMHHTARLACEQHHNVLQLATMAKELAFTKADLTVLKQRTQSSLSVLSGEVQQALKVCLPLAWAPSMEKAPNHVGTTRGRTTTPAAAGGGERAPSSHGQQAPGLLGTLPATAIRRRTSSADAAAAGSFSSSAGPSSSSSRYRRLASPAVVSASRDSSPGAARRIQRTGSPAAHHGVEARKASASRTARGGREVAASRAADDVVESIPTVSTARAAAAVSSSSTARTTRATGTAHRSRLALQQQQQQAASAKHAHTGGPPALPAREAASAAPSTDSYASPKRGGGGGGRRGGDAGSGSAAATAGPALTASPGGGVNAEAAAAAYAITRSSRRTSRSAAAAPSTSAPASSVAAATKPRAAERSAAMVIEDLEDEDW